jgi:hypothetical protein
VHPEGHDALVFAAQAPTAGTWFAYLQFQHDGVVRTATFEQEVSS